MPRQKKTDADTDTDTPTPEPTIDYVVGSNKGHAERAGKNRGVPTHQCIAIDKATADIVNGKNILLARDPADRAANWDQLENDGATIIE